MYAGAVILSKQNGGVVTDSEAREILEHYGPIELCLPTNTGNRRYPAACGMYIKFAYYLDCRDALRVSSTPRQPGQCSNDSSCSKTMPMATISTWRRLSNHVFELRLMARP